MKCQASRRSQQERFRLAEGESDTKLGHAEQRHSARTICISMVRELLTTFCAQPFGATFYKQFGILSSEMMAASGFLFHQPAGHQTRRLKDIKILQPCQPSVRVRTVCSFPSGPDLTCKSLLPDKTAAHAALVIARAQSYIPTYIHSIL